MKTFNQYLIDKGLKQSTITDIHYRLEKYKRWCKSRRYDPETIAYKALVKYIKYLKDRYQQQPTTINNQLHRIKTYFDYLIEEDIRADNPLEDVKVKGKRVKLFANVLSNDELEDLYYSFETENIKDVYHRACAKRNKIITGLMVYQALNNTDLSNLKTEHLELYKGKIYIPNAGNNNSRTLELKPWQVIELLEYMNQVRPQMQKRMQSYDDKLFPLNTSQFNNILNAVVKKLKTYNAKVTNARHIRASVITNWLKRNNIREVQQMCGHKYIGSTEKYKQDSLEDLQKSIKNFHPLS
ncbi:tyrosine-type recombinase/integrase [Aquimarina sp. U1-2]|uniref:tyrosine-type recombinase/integrase n=1 Tax=Aquimarina sp. U1-2 TaxID=2823141 RepID=UPI001AECA62C|nr:tyrosine-type recombinase/integrase [Aquimarina sp. U1-2]MBP2834242.1 tyrosine-type recombinase/integrase [Aquimarina sp. U1-2]